MAGVFSSTTKLMLKNVIRHTNSHNKVVDEAEMWQQYDRMKELGGLDPSNPSYGHDDRCDSRSGRNGRADYWNNRSTRADYLSTSHRYKRAHMDDTEERGSHSVEKTSTYWTRQLEKFESSDPNRWDHSGFKEMYPDDFNSDRSGSSSEASTSRHKTRKKSSTKKKERHKSRRRKHRAKDKKSTHRHKKRAVRHQSSSSDSDTDSDTDSDVSSSTDSDTPPRKSRHKSKKRHHNRSKSRNYSSSDDSSSSDSESDSESSDKKRLSRKVWREKKPEHCPSESASFSGRKKGKKRKKSSSEHHKDRRKKSKKHKKKRSSDARKKQENGPERENQLVVEMWKEVYGPKDPTSNDHFDKHLRKEIANQYHSLKRKYLQAGEEGVKCRGTERDTVRGSELEHKGKKRRRDSQFSSGDSD